MSDATLCSNVAQSYVTRLLTLKNKIQQFTFKPQTIQTNLEYDFPM